MFFIGLDLGKQSDYTAVTVIETTEVPPDKDPVRFRVRFLQRFPLGTSYVHIVQKVLELRQRLKEAFLIIDATGVGQAVVDLFRFAGLAPVCVTITGGKDVSVDPKKPLEMGVPKKDLVGVLVVAFQNGTLHITNESPDSQAMMKELQNFHAKVNNKTGNVAFEAWREQDHDDLVLALAIAIWAADRDRGYKIPLDLIRSGFNTAPSALKPISPDVDPFGRPRRTIGAAVNGAGLPGLTRR